MPEQDVGGETYIVYGDVEAADIYHGASIHGDTWRAADEDTKARALVSATRTLDRQQWQDAYNTFELRVVEEPIVNASYELALSLLDGSDVQNVNTMEERIRSISAGSVNITNFRGVGTATRFPQIVQELLQGYLGSSTASSSLVATATGVDTESIFPIDLGYNTGGM